MTGRTFCLHLLPAGNGDALVLEYGTAGPTRRSLVDGGQPPAAGGVHTFLGDDAELDLLVITHIDTDHIGGVLDLLDLPHPPRPRDVWFNGFRHLPTSRLQEMGPVAGEKLTAVILSRALPWNAAFGGHAVAVEGPGRPLLVHTLEDGPTFTVLSPGHDQLARLRKDWLPVVQEADLDPTAPATPAPVGTGIERMGSLDVDLLAARTTPKDATPANGASIALLVEWAGRRVLLTGDAHPDVILAGVDRLVGPQGVLAVDVVKLPHHGSKANVTTELLRRVRAGTYVFSTDGSGNQRHPNDEAVARVITTADAPTLAFNYRTERTGKWDDAGLRERYGYSTAYPPADRPGLLTIDLLARTPS